MAYILNSAAAAQTELKLYSIAIYDQLSAYSRSIARLVVPKMSYDKQLPHIRDFGRLSHRVHYYPATRDDLVRAAYFGGFPSEMEDFLHQFSPSRTFQSPADFQTQAEELSMLITQERESPFELLKSPQD